MDKLIDIYKEVFGGIWGILNDIIGVVSDLLEAFGITGSAMNSFSTIIQFFITTLKFAMLPLTSLIKLVKTLTGVVKGAVDIFKNWKNMGIEDIFNRIGDGIRDFIHNNPLADFGRSVKEIFTGASESSFSFTKDMAFSFSNMKKTAKEGTLTIETMAQHFADSFENMSDKQKEAIKGIRVAYLKSVQEWIEGALTKLRAEGFLNQSLAEQIRALDTFAKEAKSKMDAAMAEITGAGDGGDFSIIPDMDVEGAADPKETLEKSLQEIQNEYRRAIALSTTMEDKLQAEYKATEAAAEAYRRFAAIDGFDDIEIAIMQGYQVELNGIKASLTELEEEKERIAEQETLQRALEREIKAIKESLLTEEEALTLSYANRAEIIRRGMDEGIIAIAEGEALIEELMAKMNESLTANGTQVASWANTWEEAMKSVEDSMSNMVADMVTSSVEMFASGQGMASVGLMIMRSFADMAIQIGKIAVGTAIAISGIREALKSLNPVVAAAAGLALIALGGFVKSQLSSVGNVQGLATGGDVYKGGIFKVGEQGEELVHLPKGAAVTPNHMLNSGAGGMELTTRIAGRDLEIILQRTEAQTKRR
jgi:hypothetical protein